MELSKISIKIINHLINLTDKYNITQKKNNDTTKHYGLIYEYIHNSLIAASKEPIKNKFSNKLVVPSSNLLVSKYIPRSIQIFIRENSKYQITSTFTIKNITFNLIRTTTIDNTLIDETWINFVQICAAWIAICINGGGKSNTKNITAFFYDTPFKRTLPTSSSTSIGPTNVNGGVTLTSSNINEFIVFRHEEWLKVFLHETMHIFNMGTSPSSSRTMSINLKKLFKINSTIDINETYIETWARIMNVAFSVYLLGYTRKNDFIKAIKHFLNIECLFASMQAKKILASMDITLEMLCDSKFTDTIQTLYHEETNVFAYYILTAALLENPSIFMDWCIKHNSQVFKFTNTPDTAHSFVSFVEHTTKDSQFQTTHKHIPLQSIYCVKPQTTNRFSLRRTLRMSAIELDSI